MYNEEPNDLNFHWAIYNAMSTSSLEPIVAKIEFEADIEGRTAAGRAPGLFETKAERIRNPPRSAICMPGLLITAPRLIAALRTTTDANLRPGRKVPSRPVLAGLSVLRRQKCSQTLRLAWVYFFPFVLAAQYAFMRLPTAFR